MTEPDLISTNPNVDAAHLVLDHDVPAYVVAAESCSHGLRWFHETLHSVEAAVEAAKPPPFAETLRIPREPAERLRALYAAAQEAKHDKARLAEIIAEIDEVTASVPDLARVLGPVRL